MATTYTGDPTATQSPGPTPAVGNYPIVSIPDDGDALNAASVAQAYKELADFLAYTQTYPMILGSTYVLNEDFDTSAIPARFTLTTGTGAIVDDQAAGAIGTYRLSASTGGLSNMAAAAKIFTTSGTLVMNTRLRLPNGVTSGSTMFVRLTDTFNTHYVTVTVAQGTNSNKWFVNVDGVSHNTSVSPSTSTYQLMTVSLSSGTLTVSFDGTVAYTQAYSSAIEGGHLQFELVDGTTGTTQMCVDYVKMWVQR